MAACDAVTGNHEGWLLDDFLFGGTLLGIEEINGISKRLSIYPNPTTDILNVELENEEINCISIFSLAGAVIKEFSETNSINVIDLKPGIYLLKVNNKHIDKLIVK